MREHETGKYFQIFFLSRLCSAHRMEGEGEERNGKKDNRMHGEGKEICLCEEKYWQ